MPAWCEWRASKKKAFGPIKSSRLYMDTHIEIIAAVLLIILNLFGHGKNRFSNFASLGLFCFGSILVSYFLAIYINRYLRKIL